MEKCKKCGKEFNRYTQNTLCPHYRQTDDGVPSCISYSDNSNSPSIESPIDFGSGSSSSDSGSSFDGGGGGFDGGGSSGDW